MELTEQEILGNENENKQAMFVAKYFLFDHHLNEISELRKKTQNNTALDLMMTVMLKASHIVEANNVFKWGLILIDAHNDIARIEKTVSINSDQERAKIGDELIEWLQKVAAFAECILFENLFEPLSLEVALLSEKLTHAVDLLEFSDKDELQFIDVPYFKTKDMEYNNRKCFLRN